MVTRIGLDLDGVFVGLPPFIPYSLIDWLYKDHNEQRLKYRIPGFLEQKIRQLSHLPFVRPPIKQNHLILKHYHDTKKYHFYLISGRFGFLKNLTLAWLKRYGLIDVFDKIYFNINNVQPHEYKEKILSELNLDTYIEDDFDSIIYLASKFRKTHFYWYTENKSVKLNAGNITAIDDLGKILK